MVDFGPYSGEIVRTRDRRGYPMPLFTLGRVAHLFLFLLYEQVAQALIRFFGVLPPPSEPSDGTAGTP